MRSRCGPRARAERLDPVSKIPSCMAVAKTVKSESVFPLKSRKYKVSATVGVSTVIMTALRAILDTGAGQNLIKETNLPGDWERFRAGKDSIRRVWSISGWSWGDCG
jgi:Retroviral aspartyl protease